MSPADRVFGWVRQSERSEDEDIPETAVRGNLRIGPVHGPLVDEAVEDLGEGIPLEILSAPKPSQGRFYVARDAEGNPLERHATKESFFGDDRSLRGRKVYPHQQAAEYEAEHWSPEHAGQEFRRPGAKRDDQNRTVTSWVRPEQEFTFTVDVRNLSDTELGALLWLLVPEQCGRVGTLGRHRMGGGKPLGFGSVELQLAEDGHDLRRGRDWLDEFRALDPNSIAEKPAFSFLAEQFERQMRQMSGGAELLDEFRARMVGFTDEIPVHYPRTAAEKDPDGKNYEWFVKNERAQQNGPRGKQKDADPLPDFGKPLPYKPSS